MPAAFLGSPELVPLSAMRMAAEGPITRLASQQQGRARGRPVKVQQRTSCGCWRTLQGLADFAVVQSYLSTAAKWGIDAPDALTQLFIEGPWLPAAIRPG